jgi:hypothetical protein
MWMHVCMLACVHVQRICCHKFGVWGWGLGVKGAAMQRDLEGSGSDEARKGKRGKWGVISTFVCRLHNACVSMLILPSLSPPSRLPLAPLLSPSLTARSPSPSLCPFLSISISARREDEIDESRVYPNRALGGVVAIELRCPHGE